MNESEENYCLCWWQPEQWERLVEISEDRDKLDDSYDDWRSNANETISCFQQSGRKVKKVRIDLEKLLVWCNKKGIDVNGKSRAEYAALISEKRTCK